MLIETIPHLRSVLERMALKRRKSGRHYFVYDTETGPKENFSKDDALVYDRANIKLLAFCHSGESYSCPTSYFDPQYPTPEEWGEELAEIFHDRSIVKVAHNWNYDANVNYTSLGVKCLHNLHCTYIGVWKASEYVKKGLKVRAPLYGRYLRETKTVDFTNKLELAEYGEQDVIQADEIFQMQKYGEVRRPRFVFHLNAAGIIKQSENPLYKSVAATGGRFKVKNEGLSEKDKLWLKLVEYPILRSVLDAERLGVPVHQPRLAQARIAINTEVRRTLQRMYRMAGRAISLKSNKDLTDVFKKLGIQNFTKTKTGKLSFNAAAISKIKGAHPFVELYKHYTAVSTLRQNYVGTRPLDRSLPYSDKKNQDCGIEYFIHPDDGAVHCTIDPVGAITGRSAASGPNMQQIPSKKDLFKLKEIFVATPVPLPGQVFVRKFPKRKLIVLDYAQLELRVMALFCKDGKMCSVLRDPKGDLHNTTSEEFNVTRDSAKNLNFLLLYGGEEYMLSEKLSSLGIPTTMGEAAVFIKRHHVVYPRVVQFRKALLRHHYEHGFVYYFTGRKRHIPGIEWDNKRSVHKAETTLANNTVQGSGQDFLKAAIVRADWRRINPDAVTLQRYSNLSKSHILYLKDKQAKLEKLRRTLRLADARFRLQVHDEVLFTSVPEAANECADILAEIMSWRHYIPTIDSYSVPLISEGGVGDSWKEAKSKEPQYHVKAGFTDYEKYAQN